MTDAAAELAMREAAPRVLGALIRRFGDFTIAEDAVQEALLAALTTWPKDGVPLNPGGWLFQVACRRMADLLDQERARRRRETVAVERARLEQGPQPMPEDGDASSEDDALALLFMCCHPALTWASAVALTLRAVGGLTTAEIASAFMVPESTMAQRISRAKQSIEKSGIPLRMPVGAERAERSSAVQHVLYLLFNEGYAGSVSPQLLRVELAAEAIRLTRLLHHLDPDECETAGLLALMLLTDARRRARTGPAGELIPLDEQDRTLWDRAAIAEGTALIDATLTKGVVGAYQLQAAIAALHDAAPRADLVDWPQILALYDLLKRITDNPMVALNHAVAAAMVHGPMRGLALLDALAADPRIAGHYRLDAVRAHLCEFAGNHQAAIIHYRAAAERTAGLPERNYLMTRAARLSGVRN
ncbi:MAG: DUF6596 domain-containing protein [Planctomycetota bacterium]